MNKQRPSTATAGARDGSAAEGAGEKCRSGVRGGLLEDRLQVVLDGVLGQGHLVRDVPGVDAGGESGEQFCLARGQPEGPGEEGGAVGWGGLLDGDRDVPVLAGTARRRSPAAAARPGTRRGRSSGFTVVRYFSRISAGSSARSGTSASGALPTEVSGSVSSHA